ncbi:malto-oligosyltrehalose synthase [Novosphingobium terrae]|uniref:malto-oligosyltrehalose synthase n=1 Tax=Novosphingobium terrae TaxID=2726189 RepID=UPI001980D219|nr:malto-oligosyltrehalose synthase [Novosphingobium terrae]
MTASAIPRATYRLQLHGGFTFTDARNIVPYLAALGVSHLYASPITMAAPGSLHGYDVTDPRRINPELGGEEGLMDLVEALRANHMGLIVDIVPNHMGVAGDSNAFWRDVLARGQASPHARLFDIDWDQPIALPVLDGSLEESIASGTVRLVDQGEGKGLQVGGGAIYPARDDDPGLRTISPDDHAAVAELARRQHYRLIDWRTANDRLNWRRFFAINDLAGVRVEDEAVFAFTHQLFLDLFARGLIDGVRVDHVDGLADPTAYCRHLRQALVKAGDGREPYIVVEKILATEEQLPPEWPVQGTTGYDFMREVSALLHDAAGMTQLSMLWARSSGRPADFAQEALQGRRDMLSWQFEGQLNACLDSLEELAATTGKAPTRGMLRRAVTGLLHAFPIYRTYGTGEASLPGDALWRQAARKAMAVPPGEGRVADLILRWLAGDGPGDAALKTEAVRLFQQLSAPIAAKGVEDTAFYRYGALLSANDVGFDPAKPALSVEAFHQAMTKRACHHPHAMLALATHDHKRGADARARLSVLSTIPGIWEETLQRWIALAAPFAEGIDPGDLHMLLQALIGAWEGALDEALLHRLHGWQRKALREARLRSSWEAPDESYEVRCHDLASALFGNQPFLADARQFLDALAAPALAASLGQTALHHLVPGVPDIYQGGELGDFSMVDPDNRRPVDFARRTALLADPEGDPKLDLIAQLLSLRRHGKALALGDYQPLAVTGRRAEHVVAFLRRHGDEALCCAVAIRLGKPLFGGTIAYPAPDWWEDTAIHHQGNAWLARDLFGGQVWSVTPA